MDNRPIGVFDSGVGGMTVLREMIKMLPQEKFIYFADTKNFPYGSKSSEDIIQLTKKGIEFLITQDVKVIVIACGTATSQALDIVKELYDIPIIGVIEPAVKYLKTAKKKNIGVIATKGTIRSNAWEELILKQIPQAHVESLATPLLAPMIEEGWYDNKIAKYAIKEYLKSFKKMEALILGCTHYPLLHKVIKRHLGKKVEIINIGLYAAKETEKILKENDICARNEKQSLEIYVTDIECNFNHIASKLLEREIQAKQLKEEIK